jgi:superfamily II DNA or RNA helicase
MSMVSGKGFLYAGFLPYLRERFNVELENEIEFDQPFNEQWAHKIINGRYYQNDALHQLLYHNFRGVYSLPTGTGKTVLAAMVMASMPKAKCLFVVHTKDLLDQSIIEFKHLLGEKIGSVGEGKQLWNLRTVGMIQSLKDYSFTKRPIDIVMVDESHHVPADSYIALLRKTKCPVRIGFTGTVRDDQEGMMKSMGILGDVIYDYPYQQAVSDGYLSQAYIKMLQPETCLQTAQNGAYRDVYNMGIIHHQNRNELIVREARGFVRENGLTCLVQVKETQHGELLAGMFGDDAEYIHGGTSREQRLAVKNELKIGKIKIVICSPIWDEGIDLPDLGAIIVAGGGKSSIKSIQKVGRGLRKTKEKDVVQVVDFYDNSHRYLRSHSRERVRIYESRGWVVER